MALYEYFCQPCNLSFEQMTAYQNSQQAECPHCHTISHQKLLSRFAIMGQGDQRESTLHGCHGYCPTPCHEKTTE